jgi:hypothetical protein
LSNARELLETIDAIPLTTPAEPELAALTG